MIVCPRKPMKAETLEGDWSQLRFPVLATPKKDGYRTLTIEPIEAGKKNYCVGSAMAATRNAFVRKWIEENLPVGLDGELGVVDANGKWIAFHKISSSLSRGDGRPNFRFLVFDDFRGGLDEPYVDRMKRLAASKFDPARVELLLPVLIHNIEELEAFEAKALAAGDEGVMIRSLGGKYKQGRATLNEQWLLKIKRFTDGEAEVLSVFEEMENTNKAGVDLMGHTKRSHCKDGMKGKGIVGGFVVRDIKDGRVFDIGLGCLRGGKGIPMSEAPKLIGKLIKYKKQTVGAKDLPRIPICLGWRDRGDMTHGY